MGNRKRLSELGSTYKVLGLLGKYPVRVEMKSVQVFTQKNRGWLSKSANVEFRGHTCVNAPNIADRNSWPWLTAEKEHALHTCKDLSLMHRSLVFRLTNCERLTLQEQLQPRKYGKFGDLADPGALRKLCRIFCEKRAILELYVSNRRERRWRRYRGSSRISFRHWCGSRLCSTDLSKYAQNGKQANWDDLQSRSSESQNTNLFAKQMWRVRRSYVAISGSDAEEHDARRQQDVQSREFGDSSDNRPRASRPLRSKLSSSFVAGAGVTGAGNRGGRIGSSRARHSTCFVYQDQGTRPFIPHFRAQRSSLLLVASDKQEWNQAWRVNGGPIKCIHLAHRLPHASARKAFSGLDWRKAE